VQVVAPFAGFALPAADLAGVPEEERAAEALQRVRAEALRPFDLRRGPLLRTLLVRVSEDESLLLLALHHAVSDAWSVRVLFREVGALYSASLRGEPSPLPEPEVQYADFAVWQREWLAGDVLERQLDWWRERLEGAPPVLEIPTDHPRPPVPSSRGATSFRLLAPERAEALRALARREGATLYMVLLAAWDVLLARWSGQDDVVVGTPIAGRTRREVEGTVGFFVNTLALRADLSDAPTFRGLLARVREETLGAHAHQDLPFERLVEALAVERSLAWTPLFQVMFSLEDAAGLLPALPGVVVEEVDPGLEVSEFDLGLRAQEREDGLGLLLHYRPELWDAASVERMLDAYSLLLEGVLADPGHGVFDLPLVREEERRTLEEWSAGDADAALVHRLFAAQAARTPQAVALWFRGERLSYAELDRRANRLAGRLRALGVGPETRVGVCLERTPELVVALLGVLKAGGAYVPLDPAYPRERLGWMLEDACARLVLTTTALAGLLPERAEPLALDSLRDEVGAGGEAEPETGVGPENLSHVIFTSGSTGRPKGVMIRHSSVAVLLHWLRENVSDEERSSVLFSTSVSFDVSVAEIFGTLCWGGKLVLVENALELAGVEEPVVHASMVPSAAAELLRSGGIPASVRTLNLGGEALPNDLAQALYATGTVEKVGNLYGPTEDTTYSTYSLVERGADRVRIGRPLTGTRAHVLDARLQPVPIGAIGELYLAGDGVARGYAGRPDLTAERFLPDPFGAPGARMYRVQDRVRWTAGGELEYFGRTDFQVKVRGFRIELGEIEAALRSRPEVGDAVATVREDAPGERRLVAYVVAASSLPAEELRAHLRERLPEYMVPSALVFLDEIPRTPNGKADRGRLPAPEGPTAAAGYVAPRTPAEQALAGIFSETLGVERVGVHDGFFELGGHSLLVMRLVSRVRAVLGVEVPLRAVFDAQTVAELAARVEGLLRDGAGAQAPPLVPVPRDAPPPLSFAQQRLWFVHRLEPESAAYNMPLGLRLRGPLDARVLERAVAGVVRRHEVLRTTFEEAGGVPVQVVHPAGSLPLPLAELSGLPADAREAEALRLVAEAARRPFDLRRGPLFHASLVRLG
ncbi:MAG TPA: amino acid adenylation domain-containing protein, partial [Longimicrobiaceae bacterium]